MFKAHFSGLGETKGDIKSTLLGLDRNKMSMGDVLIGSAYDNVRGSDRWMDANQSSSRLFEKSKIKVLQGEMFI